MTTQKKAFTLTRLALSAVLMAASFQAFSQVDVIRKNLPSRLTNFPPIVDVKESPVKGVYEVVIEGSQVLYTDSKGDHIFQGSLIDTRNLVNLTDARIADLSKIDFDQISLKDSFKIVNGTGEREMAIFVDPNCGFCKEYEKSLAKVKDVTIHVFLMPVLGQDSLQKSNAIWCSASPKDAYLGLMLENKMLSAPAKECDASAVARNVEFGKKYAIRGTPASFFVDGNRVPGMTSPERIEESLQRAAAATQKTAKASAK